MARLKFTASVDWATRAAATWCVAFALLHLFWALGGSFGLASSAGPSLAHRRPTSFVVFGLYGGAAILLVGGAVLLVTDVTPASRRRTTAVILLFGVGVVLVLRGVGLEVVLAANIGGVRQQIGPLEMRWSQILWNPWFALGGCLFVASSVQAYRHPPASRSR